MAQQLATLTDLSNLGPPPAAFPASIGDPVKTAHLLSASGRALSYIGKRYSAPLVTWGADVVAAVVAIATYTLLARRGFDPANAADAMVVKAYDDAIAWLRDVAKGLAQPVDLVDSTQVESDVGPLFEAEEPLGWPWPSAEEDA